MDELVVGPAEAAGVLGISRASLRSLTRAGAIGHVRLGLGTQRHRVGYTPAQLESFIQSRSVPAAPETIPVSRGAVVLARSRATLAHGKPQLTAHSRSAALQAIAADHLAAAIAARGDVVEWKPPAWR